MEKPDYTWVAIRLFGVYLLIQAVISIPILAGAIIFMCDSLSMHDLDVGADNQARFAKGLYAALRTDVVRSSVAVLLYALVGFYLTFRGKLLHRWIGRS
jgi:hypothetical protein